MPPRHSEHIRRHPRKRPLYSNQRSPKQCVENLGNIPGSVPAGRSIPRRRGQFAFHHVTPLSKKAGGFGSFLCVFLKNVIMLSHHKVATQQRTDSPVLVGPRKADYFTSKAKIATCLWVLDGVCCYEQVSWSEARVPISARNRDRVRGTGTGI